MQNSNDENSNISHNVSKEKHPETYRRDCKAAIFLPYKITPPPLAPLYQKQYKHRSVHLQGIDFTANKYIIFRVNYIYILAFLKKKSLITFTLSRCYKIHAHV